MSTENEKRKQKKDAIHKQQILKQERHFKNCNFKLNKLKQGLKNKKISMRKYRQRSRGILREIAKTKEFLEKNTTLETA